MMSLAETHPEIAAEFHPTLNANLSATAVTYGSHHKLWWRCSLGHEWRTAVYNRSIGGNNCPWCCGSRVLPECSLAALRPSVAAQLHPARNGNLDPKGLAPHSARILWWQCARGHAWQAAVASRSHQRGCPWCSGRRYLVRESVFSSPMSPLALYHLGFLAADGNISDGAAVQFGLQLCDCAAVARFARFCGLSSDRLRVAGDRASVSFTSAQVARDLANHGLVPRKSRTLAVSVEATASPSFWLGYLDGDGWAQPALPGLFWVSGSRHIMEQCAAFWAVRLGRAPKVSHNPARGTYGVSLQGSSAQHGAEILLAATPESLERKRIKLAAITTYTSVRVRARHARCTRPCGWCGADVVRPPSWEAHLKSVFCGREHYLAWRRNGQRSRPVGAD